MKSVVTDLPSSIEVDGKTYPINLRNGHWLRVAMNNSRTNPEWVEADNLTKLADKIRLWILATEAERAEKKRRQEELAGGGSPIYAMHAHQRVQVRGWHQGQDDMLLVTYPNGKKDKVAQRHLLTADAPAEHIQNLYTRYGDLSQAMNDLDEYFSTAMKPYDDEVIEIRYRHDTDDFDASIKLNDINYHAVKPTAMEARSEVETMVACDLLPWSITFEGEDERVAHIVPSTEVYRGHSQGYRTREAAERWIELHDEQDDLGQEIRDLETEFAFDYEAALANAE